MSFDFIAPRYRALETLAFGNALQCARVAFLREAGSIRRALIAGEGNGRFLHALRRKHPGICVDCVDASARMLQLAKAHVHDDARVRFLHEDLKVWSPELAQRLLVQALLAKGESEIVVGQRAAFDDLRARRLPGRLPAGAPDGP